MHRRLLISFVVAVLAACGTAEDPDSAALNSVKADSHGTSRTDVAGDEASGVSQPSIGETDVGILGLDLPELLLALESPLRCSPDSGDVPSLAIDGLLLTDPVQALSGIDDAVVAVVKAVGETSEVADEYRARGSLTSVEYEIVHVITTETGRRPGERVSVALPSQSGGEGCSKQVPAVGSGELLFLSSPDADAPVDSGSVLAGRRIGIDRGRLNAWPPLMWATWQGLAEFDGEDALDFVRGLDATN
jgi:hypothetical protein